MVFLFSCFGHRPAQPTRVPRTDIAITQSAIQSISKSSIGNSRSRLRQYKQTISLTEESAQACVGMVLGDANLQSQDLGKTYRLKFEVGEHNLPYLRHIKNEVLEPFILGEPQRLVRVNAKGNTVVTYQLQTISHPNFNFLRSVFFNNNCHKSIDCRE